MNKIIVLVLGVVLLVGVFTPVFAGDEIVIPIQQVQTLKRGEKTVKFIVDLSVDATKKDAITANNVIMSILGLQGYSSTPISSKDNPLNIGVVNVGSPSFLVIFYPGGATSNLLEGVSHILDVL